MIELVRVDWSRLALDLRVHGVSHVSASKRVGESKGFVAQLARGEILEPKFSQGILLLNLHVDVCGSARTRALLR